MLATHRERRNVGDERVDHRRLRIGHDEHVGGVDRLPPTNRRAVEAEAVFEDLLGKLFDRGAEVLPDPEQVDELQVDELNTFLFGKRQNLTRRSWLFRARARSSGISVGPAAARRRGESCLGIRR
jgi:hypothetical protein